ncbi:MAG: ferredoxin [Elainellaceae cyanobacterium]
MTNPASNPLSHESKTPGRRCVLVCQHRSCQRNGSEAVLATFKAISVTNVFVSGSDCTGQCSSGPTVRVMPDKTWYCRVKPEDVPTIVDEHLRGDRPVKSLLHPRMHPQFDTPD